MKQKGLLEPKALMEPKGATESLWTARWNYWVQRGLTTLGLIG